MVTRTLILKTILIIRVLFIKLLLLGFCFGAGAQEKPNIIFIMSDDHTTQAVSAYGKGLNNTPNIDRLAKEGILFKNAFVTNSICAPSRAVILTGKHSHLNSIKTNHDVFDGSQETFPKILRKHGYQTAIIGKWHLKSHPTGFDYWNVLPGQGDYYNPDFIKNGKDTLYNGYVTDITTDLALDWLSENKSEKPFMLMVHHKAPHRNWQPHAKHLNKYEGNVFELPKNYFDKYEGREHLNNQQLTVENHLDMVYDFKMPCDTCGKAKVNERFRKYYYNEMARFTPEQLAAWNKGYEEEVREFKTNTFSEKEWSKWKLNRYLQDYMRCILSVDESVGKIIDYVDASGLAENTIIIYTSDQGFFLGEHGLFDKRYMYEESLRTPLLMRYPAKIEAGTITENLVQNLDIAPTLLSIAGIKKPDFMQGISLTPLFKNPKKTKNWRNAIYYQFFEEGWGVSAHYGIRTKKYKLIRYQTEPESWEFFDLAKDSNEMNNAYANPNYTEVIAGLKQKMSELRTEYRVH